MRTIHRRQSSITGERRSKNRSFCPLMNRRSVHHAHAGPGWHADSQSSQRDHWWAGLNRLDKRLFGQHWFVNHPCAYDRVDDETKQSERRAGVQNLTRLDFEKIVFLLPPVRVSAVTALTIAVLAACGGGSDSSDSHSTSNQGGTGSTNAGDPTGSLASSQKVTLLPPASAPQNVSATGTRQRTASRL